LKAVLIQKPLNLENNQSAKITDQLLCVVLRQLCITKLELGNEVNERVNQAPARGAATGLYIIQLSRMVFCISVKTITMSAWI